MMDLKKVFSDENPLFQHAEIALWVAVRQGQEVGRIAGIVDHSYIEHQKDHAAFFGFFECVQDEAIAHALFQTVFSWAKQKGLTKVLGPMNPTTNDECGLLIQGFDSSPVLMMTYNPPYYAELIEKEGFAKAKDLLAFYMDLNNTPAERFEKFSAKLSRREPNIKLVPIRRKTLKQDLGKIKIVYNEAWQKNWGFMPMTDAEINFMADRLAPLLVEGFAFVVEDEGKPVGFFLGLLDFNEAFKPLRGKLFTPHIFQALPYFLGWKRPQMLRVVTLGVTAKYRGRGIETIMMLEAFKTCRQMGITQSEASWILEDNLAVQKVIGLIGGQVYKTYRIYEKTL
jgi:GNAT superfamily N-acetyltransferase